MRAMGRAGAVDWTGRRITMEPGPEPGFCRVASDGVARGVRETIGVVRTGA